MRNYAGGPGASSPRPQEIQVQGLDRRSATGTSMTWKEVHVFRCAGGRIAEDWGVFDMLGILQQLGAIPA
jgi:SnoaL-like polyketide cyclase